MESIFLTKQLLHFYPESVIAAGFSTFVMLMFFSSQIGESIRYNSRDSAKKFQIFVRLAAVQIVLAVAWATAMKMPDSMRTPSMFGDLMLWFVVTLVANAVAQTFPSMIGLGTISDLDDKYRKDQKNKSAAALAPKYSTVPKLATTSKPVAKK